MLQVQVSYWDLQEKIRHDVAVEGYNTQQIELGYSNLAESKRHNVVTEGIAQGNLSELIRHNSATESISQEANRIQNNFVEGQLSIGRENAETNRMNAYSNAVSARAQTSQAVSAMRNATTNAQNAATNAQNAVTNSYKSKTERANMRINQGEFDLKAYRTKWDTRLSVASMWNNLMGTVSRIRH